MNNREWWDSLSDDQKWENYELLNKVNTHNCDILHRIVRRLLGDDYYTMASDWYNSPLEIWDSICYHYKDVNYSFGRSISKIKKTIKEYFKNGN